MSKRIPKSGWQIPYYKVVTHKQVQQLAEIWEIDCAEEVFLLWIVQEALETPLPPKWSMEISEEGTIIYRDKYTDEETDYHPALSYFMELIAFEREYLEVNPPNALVEDVWLKYPKVDINLEEVAPIDKTIDSDGEMDYYYYNFSTSTALDHEPSVQEGVLLEQEVDALALDRTVAVSMKQGLDKLNFESSKVSRPRPKKQSSKGIHNMTILKFKSWWIEVDQHRQYSQVKKHMTVKFHLDSGNVEVYEDKADKVFTLSHINGKNGPLQCWDMYVGATVNVLGRQTTLAKGDRLTVEWLNFHHKRLDKVLRNLKAQLQKYDVKFNTPSIQSRLRNTREYHENKYGKANLRSYLADITFLYERLAKLRPKIAEKMFQCDDW